MLRIQKYDDVIGVIFCWSVSVTNMEFEALGLFPERDILDDVVYLTKRHYADALWDPEFRSLTRKISDSAAHVGSEKSAEIVSKP